MSNSDFIDLLNSVDGNDLVSPVGKEKKTFDVSTLFDLSEANTMFILTEKPVLCYNEDYNTHFFVVGVNKIVSYPMAFNDYAGLWCDTLPQVNTFSNFIVNDTHWLTGVVLESFDPNYTVRVKTL